MEPTILLIGKNLDTLEFLKGELKIFNRNIVYANSEEQIELSLKNKKIDIIIVGAGLPDESIDVLVAFIKSIDPKIELHIMSKIPGMTPVSMIGYTNEKAIMWKLRQFRK